MIKLPLFFHSVRASIITFCVICCLGVNAYAANTGLSVTDHDSEHRNSDYSSSYRASNTDIQGVLEDDNMDSTVIYLQHGQVVIANNFESDMPGRSASSSIGYTINVISTIGSVIQVPSEYVEDSFTIDSNNYLIGVRASPFTCYIGEYQLRFPAYSTPQFRISSGSGYIWQDINIQYVSSDNVEIIGERVNWFSDKFRNVLLTCLLTVLFILMFRRSK